MGQKQTKGIGALGVLGLDRILPLSLVVPSHPVLMVLCFSLVEWVGFSEFHPQVSH